RELQSAIGSLDTGAWDGRSRARAEPMLGRVQQGGTRVAEGLDVLGRKLVRVADVFEQEDDTAAQNLEGMPWVDFEAGGGTVLGVATAAGMAAPVITLASLPLTGDYAPAISEMSWAERFDYAKTLPEQIETLESEQQKLKDQITQDDQDIAALDQQIQDLQNKRDALQEEAGDFWNQVKRDPDGWQWGFDDGLLDAPWRTKSDALEDQIAEYDRQIQELHAQRQVLDIQHQQELSSIGQQLTTLRQSQTELNQTIQQGITPDGPTKQNNLLTGTHSLSGCTHYVATKRDVSAWPNAKGNPGHPGHAYKWNDQAQQAGYEAGSHPVKGSIVVWEGGSGWYDKTGHDCGHVAYVEWVDPNDPNHFRISEANVKTDAEGNGIRGTHTTPTTRDVYLDKEQNLSFIYDKPPESTSVA
ncbi:MAG: CHAP domain-containing protein, partial [Chloroflexota bacterium]|nr:CHAP domain-containing protein [Chloroflexota bacterium]